MLTELLIEITTELIDLVGQIIRSAIDSFSK
jgi:hypothetical protein